MIRRRKSKKAPSGYIYQVAIKYKDNFGISQVYYKSPFLTREEAKKFETIKKAELIKYGCTSTDDKKTFNDCFREYMNLKKKNYAPATVVYYTRYFEDFVKDTIGNIQITRFKYKDVQNFLNNSGFSKPTAHNIKKTLDVTFMYALKNEYIDSNPMEYVTLDMEYIETRPEKNTAIKDEDLKKFIAELGKTSKRARDPENAEFLSKAYVVAVWIGRYTGLRISEALALEKKEINLDKGTIDIQGRIEYAALNRNEVYKTYKLKTKKSKAIIPIAPKLKTILKEWFEYTPYERVITNVYGDWIHPLTLQSKLRDVSNKTGIPFRFHQGRHSFITDLGKHKIELATARDLARHSDIRTTKNLYTHMSIEDEQKALDEIYGNEEEDDG